MMTRYETIIRIVNSGDDRFDAGEKAGALIDLSRSVEELVISCSPTKEIFCEQEQMRAFQARSSHQAPDCSDHEPLASISAPVRTKMGGTARRSDCANRDSAHVADRKMKILIVDDDKYIASLVSLHVNMAGHIPILAMEGIDALEKASMEKPDAAILDLMLPGINGWHICQALRESTLTQNIPIIILSALTDPESRQKAFSSGADLIIDKPFSPKELMATLSSALARNGLESQPDYTKDSTAL